MEQKLSKSLSKNGAKVWVKMEQKLIIKKCKIIFYEISLNIIFAQLFLKVGFAQLFLKVGFAPLFLKVD